MSYETLFEKAMKPIYSGEAGPFKPNETIEIGQRIMDRSGNVYEVLDWKGPQDTHTQAIQGDVFLEFISGPRENRHPGGPRWVSVKVVREYSVKVAK
ncbi:hypothetical protein MAL1_00214 [Bacteriophage DSS3_MAL1]|nr:hypothetical protein MAL1_00214 [Bacteriophage DSS3_MAL1]